MMLLDILLVVGMFMSTRTVVLGFLEKTAVSWFNFLQAECLATLLRIPMQDDKLIMVLEKLLKLRSRYWSNQSTTEASTENSQIQSGNSFQFYLNLFTIELCICQVSLPWYRSSSSLGNRIVFVDSPSVKTVVDSLPNIRVENKHQISVKNHLFISIGFRKKWYLFQPTLAGAIRPPCPHVSPTGKKVAG